MPGGSAFVPPPYLVERTAAGKTVLFAGAGMSMPPLPGWSSLLRQMLAWAPAQGIRLDAKPILELIEQNELPLAAEELYEALGRPAVERFLRTVFRGGHLEPGPAHKLLPDLPFDAILTTNFDKLIEFALPKTPHFTQLDDAELTDWMQSPHPAIVKIHGDIDRASSIVLRAEDYNKLKFDNAPLRIFLTQVFTSRTVLFAGYSLNDPDLELLLEQLQFHLQGRLGPHFALMRRKEMQSAKAKNLKRRLGIQILASEDDDSYPDIAAFLSQLPKRHDSPPKPAPAWTPDRSPADIRKLLEAMGHRIYDHKEDCFLGEYRSGAEFRSVVTRYFSPVPAVRDVEAMAQAVAKYHVKEGILLSEQPMPAEVLAEARANGLKAYHRRQFIDGLADFKPYLQRLEAEYAASEIERYFIPLKIREERDGQPAAAPTPLDDFIDAWLADPERNHLSLLGDFGTGKTWFCRRLAQRLIERRALDGKGRIPILIPLRDDPRAYVARQLITDAVLNRFKVELPAGFETFEYLNGEGRLVVILDGFDEMERRVSDFKTAEEKFWELAKLVSPRAKVILTCRTAFFRYQKEADEILHGDLPKVRLLHKDDYIELRGKHGFDLVHLEPFDEDQIRQALRLRSPDNWEELYAKIVALPNIEDLAHRPVLLEMIVKTLREIGVGENLNLATLYESYTNGLLEARSDVGRAIEPEKRLFFVTELAWEMQQSNEFTIHYSKFPERVTSQFHLNDPQEVAFFDQDIRTQSYLVRDKEGNYGFAHKSFREFFVARRLAELLKKGEAPQIPLTDAVVSFVHYLLAPVAGYQVRIEDGMALVPAGPFVFGMESESNLRIATIEQPFWIDRYPVTNAQFRDFLEAKGLRKEWIELKWSRIEKKWSGFSVKAGYENHPVTGVTWHGAKAYAESVEKELPTEMQWEKAARGMDGRRYPWGESFDPTRCNTAEGEKNDTTRVGYYTLGGASPYGMEEAAGNVWEWTASPWAEERETLVMRGGSWGDYQGFAACAFRYYYHPASSSFYLGFRCARTFR